MIFVPLLHYFLCKNDYSGNEAGLRYRLTPGKRTVPDPDGGADATKEEKILTVDYWPAPWTIDKTDPALRRREVKIVDGNAHEETTEPAERAVKSSSNVLKYMKDESLFGGSRPSGTFGLEEKEDYGHGYGITGDPQTDVEAQPAAEKPKTISKKEAREAMLSAEEINDAAVAPEYKMPPLNLLQKSRGGARTNERLLAEKAQKLEETLSNFHVDARVVQVTQGPTVTRYEIQPAVGVKVNSIVRLADDIALNLEAKSIRIEAPIPGKAAVGIEVENDTVTMVHIRDVIDSQEFRDSKSKITFAVGKDISGKPIVADLKSMPHLLIAGSTGSGKSVCINSIIVSLLYKARPDEVKLILVDPKVVELGNYNGVPHLMIPVVTDPSKACLLYTSPSPRD